MKSQKLCQSRDLHRIRRSDIVDPNPTRKTCLGPQSPHWARAQPCAGPLRPSGTRGHSLTGNKAARKKSHALDEGENSFRKGHDVDATELAFRRSHGVDPGEVPQKSNPEDLTELSLLRDQERRIRSPLEVHLAKKASQQLPRRPKGPSEERSCTDTICCVVFLTFIVCFSGVAMLAYIYGDFRFFLFPVDSNGNPCGIGKYKKKSKLFFFDLAQCARYGAGVFVLGCPTPQICVEECPSENVFALSAVLSPDETKNKLICKDGVDTSLKAVPDMVFEYSCAAYYLKSTPVLNRCVPDVIDQAKNLGHVLGVGGKAVTNAVGENITLQAIADANKVFKRFLEAREFSENVVSDIVQSWRVVLAGLLIVVLASALWIVAMRLITGPTFFLFVFTFIGGFAVVGGLAFYMYFQTKGTGATFTIRGRITLAFPWEYCYLSVGILSSAIFFVSVGVYCSNQKRIRFALNILREGSKGMHSVYSRRDSGTEHVRPTPSQFTGFMKFKHVGNMVTVFIWPLSIASINLGVLLLCATVFLALASISASKDTSLANITSSNGTFYDEVIKNKLSNFFHELPCEEVNSFASSHGVSWKNDLTVYMNNICGVLKYTDTNDLRTYANALHAFNVLMFFWMSSFFTTLGQLTLSGTFASYYWSFDKLLDTRLFPLLSSLMRTIRYHLGSVALVSFLRGAIRFLRVIFLLLSKICRKKDSNKNADKCAMKGMNCCMWLLEQMANFVTEYVIIILAICGQNFCTSARKAVQLVANDVLRVAVVDKITDLIFFISKIVLVGLAATGTYFVLEYKVLQSYSPELNYIYVPVVLISVGAYTVTSAMFSVYKVAADTLLFSVLIDLNINDGSPEKPYFMSKSLMKVLSVENIHPGVNKNKTKCCLCL